MIGLNTNVLLRYITRDDDQQSSIACDYLATHCTLERPGFVNRVVLCELVWVLESAYKYSRDQVAMVLEMIFRTRQLQVENQEAALAALRAYRQGKADYADALIGVSNKYAGCKTTVTFDRKASKPGVLESLSG